MKRILIAATALALVPAAVAPASEPAPEKSIAKFEQKFISRTIDHHFLGVQMADLCLAKGTHPLLRETCDRTGRNQAQQIPLLQSWAADWYGRQETPNLPPNGDEILERLAEEPVGEEFDVEMAEEFIKHHRKQIRESSKCVDRAYHEELRDLCQMQIANQTKDIQDFEAVIESYEARETGKKSKRAD